MKKSVKKKSDMQDWLAATPCLENIKLPRCYSGLTDAVAVELHTFSDASTKGMGVVSYLRISDGTKYTVCFVAGKSRVVPGKGSMTIPRLELCAAVIAVKVAHQIVQEHRCAFSRVIFWTDATVVLRYLRDTKSRYKVFVANRIAAIQAYSSPGQWRYVDSGRNPADVFSRGMSPQNWAEAQLYMSGPDFLLGDDAEWPTQPINFGSDSYSHEVIASCVTANADVSVSPCDDICNDLFYRMFLRYSVFKKLVRAIAWLRRFSRWFQHFSKKRNFDERGELSAAELCAAAECAVRISQRQAFCNVVRAVEARGWRDCESCRSSGLERCC